ncbi:hypothetical protein B0H17DRAFT_885393, partial [Mycena rosella]
RHLFPDRDCCRLNFILDPSELYPYGTHPVDFVVNPAYDDLALHTTRTACWPRYYIIDFGLSCQRMISCHYDPASGSPLEDIILAADKCTPEHAKRTEPCNPFPTDIYFLGNLLRRSFI